NIQHVSVSFDADDEKFSITTGTAGAASSIETVAPAANTDLFHLLGIHDVGTDENRVAEGSEGVFSVVGAASVNAIAETDTSTVTVDGVSLQVTWKQIG